MVTAGSFRAGGLFIFVKEMINIAIKLATSITYTADGSQTNFSIPFDYLRPSFVHVAVNDAEVSEGFTVSNRGIMFDTAPAKAALVKIYRKTPTSRLVSWADASILKAIDMTIAEVQQLHILEEASDWSKTNSIVLDEEGNTWQGRNCRMSNIADPTEAQDVVTKHYLDNEEGSFTATMNALKTKTEEAASNFATDARSSANEAKSYRDAASTYATNAKNYSENVNVFVPSVSAEGVLSWSNKAGLINPPSVSIKGEKGDRGLQGVQGDMGAAATIKIGTVTTGAAGSNASVTNSGTASNAVFDFVLPKGKDGADGGVTVDEELSSTSTNPVQNKVVKAALDNRAVLDDVNTFTSPNNFDDIYMEDGINSLKWYNGSPNFVVASITSKRYTGEAATAKKATQDGDGNVITSTYATKTELNSCVKSVNNVTPDENGNVTISVSGGGIGGSITIDSALSSTSTNPVQNKVIKDALDDKANLNKNNTFLKENWFEKGVSLLAYRDSNSAIKWYQSPINPAIASIDATNYTGIAAKATQDGAGNVITETYATKSDISGVVKSVNGTKPDSNGNVTITVSGGSNVTVDTTLSATSNNAIANSTVYNALSGKLDKTGTAEYANKDSAGNVITDTYAKKSEVSGVVKSVNGTKPDASGNVTIAVSGGGGVSTSESNTWTGKQTFQKMKFNFESYNAPRISGAIDNPSSSVAVYNVQGNFTLDMSTLAGLLSNGDATLFTAYITSNGAYTLSINNAGTLKYVGSASDLAITASGLILNILIVKESSGTITSIAQATKLA